MGTEFFHADGRIDVMNLIVAICNFANVPRNGYCMYIKGLFSATEVQIISVQ